MDALTGYDEIRRCAHASEGEPGAKHRGKSNASTFGRKKPSGSARSVSRGLRIERKKDGKKETADERGEKASRASGEREAGAEGEEEGWTRVERRAAINADVFLRSLGRSDVCSGKCNHAVI